MVVESSNDVLPLAILKLAGLLQCLPDRLKIPSVLMYGRSFCSMSFLRTYIICVLLRGETSADLGC